MIIKNMTFLNNRHICGFQRDLNFSPHILRNIQILHFMIFFRMISDYLQRENQTWRSKWIWNFPKIVI